ncbi:unnamed protein product [Orchesella dallaii]|uniref:ZAD domain-containing protein n=1 Tax=Orchesella dallaii TaxID=48710 RepID=A0ABP1PSC9_9HEXA
MEPIKPITKFEQTEDAIETPNNSVGGNAAVPEAVVSSIVAHVYNNSDQYAAAQAIEREMFNGINTSTTTTSCLVCRVIVIVPKDSYQNFVDEDQRTKWVLNFCIEKGLNTADLPSRCTGETFPFCSKCLVDLQTCWEATEKRKIIEQEIDTTINQICRNVVDSQYFGPGTINPSPTADAAEAKKCMRFREKILEEQRSAHFRRSGNASSHQSSTSTGQTQLAIAASTAHDYDDIEGGPSTRAPLSSCADNSEEGAGPPVLTGPFPPTSPSPPVRRNDEIINIKKEAFDDAKYGGSDSDDPDCAPLASQRRIPSFKGVQIFKKLRKNKQKFFQCGRCAHSIDIRYKKGKVAPCTRMKMHINEIHGSETPPMKTLKRKRNKRLSKYQVTSKTKTSPESNTSNTNPGDAPDDAVAGPSRMMTD